MAPTTSITRADAARLILVPALMTLGVTVLRLTGELEHWSPRFFTGGVGGPGGIVGITWLAPVFGIYFALRLGKAGESPKSLLRLCGFAALGALLMMNFALIARLVFHEEPGFRPRLIFGFVLMAVSGLVALPAWPKLWKILLAYGLAARIPVIVVMFLAFQGHWGTHYDATPPDYPSGMALVPTWVWLGLVPQLTVWIGFTLVSGMLFGSVAEGIRRLMSRKKALPQPAM